MVDIEVDKLTNSIEETATDRSLQTTVLPAMAADLKAVLKKNGWLFNWRAEFAKPRRNVFKLITVEHPASIQGLVSLEAEIDHIYLHLVESAPTNRGSTKLYEGVPGNLFAHACRLAFKQGFEGNVAFTSKTRLVAHYRQKLGAWHIGGNRMLLDTDAARQLLKRYFPDDLL